ncbi:Ssl1-like-domain-containing protein [Hyaloraphidium curvatum]|nr:Ssl1-like-domain-containing protein [Hyaloraphidium curvatum]
MNRGLGDDDEGGLNAGLAGGYSWEDEYRRSWEVLQEDESGSLRGVVAQLQQQLKRRRLRDTKAIQRGIVRHLYLVIDVSRSMLEPDLKPTRIDLVFALAEQFVNEFFDQNPISQLGIIVTRDGLAEKLTDLGGNATEHIAALRNKANKEVRGEPSLQNALELARGSFLRTPSQGLREVLVIMGSLTSCDPGDIYETVAHFRRDGIRCSVIGLAAEVHVCKVLAKDTGGTFAVALHEAHLKDLMLDLVPPPPVTEQLQQMYGSNMMVMGFPNRVEEDSVSLCMDHNQPTRHGYICPRCLAKVCEVPMDCPICGLTLVSSPHLARSYHHLFPVGNYQEVALSSVTSQSPTSCSGCGQPFDLLVTAPKAPLQQSSQNRGATSSSGVGGTQPASRPSNLLQATSGRFECPKCLNWFCLDCDLFVHDVLSNCPVRQPAGQCR